MRQRDENSQWRTIVNQQRPVDPTSRRGRYMSEYYVSTKKKADAILESIWSKKKSVPEARQFVSAQHEHRRVPYSD
jgi:hypothetical protein